MPETYGPVVLKRRAMKLREDTGNSNIVSPLEVESRDIRQMFLITISRPFRMILHESIVSLTSLYLALAYAIFYLYFEAYPIIFQGWLSFSRLFASHHLGPHVNLIRTDLYGMSAGIAGLMFLPSKYITFMRNEYCPNAMNSRYRGHSSLLCLPLV